MAEVIAELCQNHNGDWSILEEMVYAAAESGATCAKIQSMKAGDLTHRPRFDDGKMDEQGVVTTIRRPYDAEYRRLKPLDLTDDDHYRFVEVCGKAGLKPLTTVFSRCRVPFVATLGLEGIKVASFDCSSYPLLRDLVRHNIPRVIVSTGVTFDSEIEKACRALNGVNVALLHCVSVYPTPLVEANLCRMDYLRRLCPVVGISDHSNPDDDGVKLAAAALLRGAEIVERHFTILPKRKTKDGPVSVNPQQLRELVRVSRMEREELGAFVRENVPEFELMLGSETREFSHAELLTRDYYRGRFASQLQDGEWVYNWEDRPLN